MMEPDVLDPSLHFYPFPEIDPSDLSFLDLHLFPDGDFPLSDLDLDDISVDFSLDDLLLPSDQSSPDPDPNQGSSDLTTNSNPTSPESGDSLSASGFINQEVTLEEERKSWGLKRKKDKEDGIGNPNPNPRSVKFRRSDVVNSSCIFSVGSEEGEKRKARLVRNRESAQLSRQRKKHYVEELEVKVRSMNSMIAELNSKISFVMAENASLRQQLNGNGGNGSNPSTVYPPLPAQSGPLHFPWIPYGGYPLRPNGSQVPLMPIPRLKPQQPASVPKGKKSESKKNGSKTKKVASVSLLGLLFVMLMFGGVANFRFGGSRDTVSGGLGVRNGRVLNVSGRANGLNNTEELGLCGEKMGFGAGGVNGVAGKRCQNGMAGSEMKQNSSESLQALLYVPRNGKHVEIKGILIIHSVLASERAMAQAKSEGQAKQSSGVEGAGLAISGKVASALVVPKAGREVGRHSKSFRNSAKLQRALASDSQDTCGDNLKSTPADGPLQQWFREGFAGPILSSGMCTEVFQFEVSPSSANPSGIIPVPVTSLVNVTDKLPPEKLKNRRILYPQLIPLTGSTLNNTHYFEKPFVSSNTFHGNNSVPSMVVSVLADPREAGDGDGDGMISPKSLSEIFVVVLTDSAKYVTYSCVLPLKSQDPHLVN